MNVERRPGPTFFAEIVHDRPPNFAAIAAAFPAVLVRRGLIYSYGDKVYLPNGGQLAPHLLAHESVHCARQRVHGCDKWWTDYIANRVFRRDEETLAHRVEYQWLVRHGNRAERRSALRAVASRLSGPLYGHVMTQAQAEWLIASEAA